MKSTSFAALAVVGALQLTLVGCGGGGDGTTTAVTAPSITTQPASTSVLTGATATFTVGALGTSPVYQWLKNGTAITGATAATYTTPGITYADDGAVYAVSVTNAAAAVVSSPATLHLQLSVDQQVYEGLALGTGAGSYEFVWNLDPVSTDAQVANTDWLQTDFAQLAQSPLIHGPQAVTQSAPAATTATLPVVTEEATRELVNGAILIVPVTGEKFILSYNGSEIQVDTLAADGATVAYSQLRSGYAVHTLSGPISTTPSELALPYNAIFTNTSILNQTLTYQTGADYVVYTAAQNGDRYTAFDCLATTTGNAPSPCATSTTLTAAMTAGETSISDGVTYHLADGAVATISGVSVWIATNPRPASGVGRSTVEYRIYFQLNGNVYTGALTKNSAVIGGGHYSTNGTTTYLNYQVRLNKAARETIAAAVNF